MLPIRSVCSRVTPGMCWREKMGFKGLDSSMVTATQLFQKRHKSPVRIRAPKHELEEQKKKHYYCPRIPQKKIDTGPRSRHSPFHHAHSLSPQHPDPDPTASIQRVTLALTVKPGLYMGGWRPHVLLALSHLTLDHARGAPSGLRLGL